jgi:hypothetical protein
MAMVGTMNSMRLGMRTMRKMGTMWVLLRV